MASLTTREVSNTNYSVSDVIVTNNNASEYNLENFVIIWMDNNVNQSYDTRQTKVQLRSIVNFLKIFDNSNEGISYIEKIQMEKIFLIISGTLGENVIPRIHHLSQIESIYIFCFDQDKHKLWTQKYNKVKGVYSDIEPICDELKKTISQCSNDLVPMDIIKFESNSNQQKSVHELNKQEASFMYFQLLKQLLLRMEYSKDVRDEMIEECRLHYADNQTQLKYINEFHCNYNPSEALRWYSRECFLYQILNKACRTQDIDRLYKFRFFIKDLHNQLKQLQTEFFELVSDMGTRLTVYRGQNMSRNEFEKKLKNNVNGLLSVNTFWSTTLYRELAEGYALNGSDMESVLFQISIDGNVDKNPIAYIQDFSSMTAENEVLFSIGTVFRIQSIEQLTMNGVWNVKLLLCAEEDEQLKILRDHMLTEINAENDLLNLGKLMIRMGEYTKAEQFYYGLLNESSTNPQDVYLLFNDVGTVYDAKGNYTKALECYQKALEIQQISNT
ncbi:unnamed protein product, partial [Rotaria sp. Silwood2]